MTQTRLSFSQWLRQPAGFQSRRNQSGYTLLMLILVLTMMMIMITAAAPKAKFEAKRAKELEMIHRGNQVSDAIERFRRRTNRYPNTMDELVSGIMIGVRREHFLRPSAAKDPMVNGDWRLVHPGDLVIGEFLQAWSAYTEQPIPFQLAALAGVPVQGLNNANGTALNAGTYSIGNNGGNGNNGENGQPPDGQSGSSGSGLSAQLGLNQQQADIGPIVGVVSKSADTTIRLRFGQDIYNQWLFIYIPPFQVNQGQPGQTINPGRGAGGQPGTPGTGGAGGTGGPGNRGRPGGQ